VTAGSGSVVIFFVHTDWKTNAGLTSTPVSLIRHTFATGFDLKSKSKIQDPRAAREEQPQSDNANQIVQTIRMGGW
jgi:hypothetical protein